MKKLFSILMLFFVCTLGMAQTFGNTLVIKSAEETLKFTLYVSGKKINKTPVSRITVPSVYTDEILIKLEADGKTVEKLVRLSPDSKKNQLSAPYKATYKVIAKRNKLAVKLVSMTAKS